MEEEREHRKIHKTVACFYLLLHKKIWVRDKIATPGRHILFVHQSPCACVYRIIILGLSYPLFPVQIAHLI